MKYFGWIVAVVFCLGGIHVIAQPSFYFEHYSTENGLPQFTVTDMLQDSKGFMWFSTWDGFSKFDGSVFRNYKVHAGDEYQMESNRIQHIHEDKYGNIWLHSYDDKAHCFNPRTETFKGIQSLPEYKNLIFRLSGIEIRPSGKVWLLSKEDGCICVADSLFTTQFYNRENDGLKGNVVYNVFEDSDLNSWILTDNGLHLVRNGESESSSFFFENKPDERSQHFFSAIEFGGEIWFASNRGRIWKYIKRSGTFVLFQTPAGSDLTGFQSISEKELIITTSGDGFFIYDLEAKNFRHYDKSNIPALGSNKIRELFFDSFKQFWFETEGLGIYKFDTHTGKFRYFVYKIDDPAIKMFPPASAILEDINNRVWVHPRGGGFSLYNREKDCLEPFYNEESSSDWKFSNILHSLYSDKQGNLWFCTRSHGLEKVIFDNNYFEPVHISSNEHSAVANDVRAVLQDRDGKLWVATKDRCLTLYDSNYNRIGNFSEDGTIMKNHPFSGVVYSMMQDKDDNIWLGTKTDGLFKIKKTDDSGRYRIEQFRKDPNDIYSISENIIYSIFQDSVGNIWVGTYGGGLNLVSKDSEGKTIFINHRNNLKNYPLKTGYRVRCISENKFGNICVGTTTGLIMFSSRFSRPDSICYRYYSRVAGNKESLSNNDVHGICNTRSGEMFIATFGGGLNKVTAYDKNGFPVKFNSYTVQDGLPADVCLAVLEDGDEKLWISMENGLSKFDPVKKEFETFAEIKRLMFTGSFSEASACRLKNNDLVFGFSKGILHFSPERIKNSNYKPYIAFVEFRIHNQLVPVGVAGSPLSRNIDDMDRLILSPEQNSFSIEYAALDFVLTNNIFYAYKLEGFDDEWVYVRKKRIANYTNIPKGNYLFRVKSTNSEGLWTGNEKVLPVEVLPTFWETPWAFFLYIFLFSGFVYLTVRILFTFYRLRKNVEMEKYLSEMKLRFFTDISHEIRTPLTMISAPVDYLLTDKDMPDKAKVHLKSISENAERMLRLVNQILDLRKIRKTNLKVRKIDLAACVENVCRNFSEMARKHQIRFSFVNEAAAEKVWVAPDSLEIIMMNLLSNAFKCTLDGKAITVTVRNFEKHLSVEVRDEGCGISKDEQKALFVRFSSFNADKAKPSTGIGLSIVKDLMDKHVGKVSVESELGRGSVFTVSFFKGTAHFGKDVEFLSAAVSDIGEDVPSAHVTIASEMEKQQTHEKKTGILVIEDNTELRLFIKTILEPDYTVIEAENGEEGLEKARSGMPDFIVSDIMMPCMDGIELLKELRKDINTSHIPIVLLTAKTALENKLEGLISGADDYITKPFSVQYFRARINNLLEQRKRLQSVYCSHLNLPGAENELVLQPLHITSHDEVLMKKVMETIERNIDDNEFTVDDLCVVVGMSRTVFSNKVKSLTGLPPFEFIRNIKMKKAAQLLSSGEFMVKEVSSMIGISDTKHFGRIFKTKYGVTPQEYKNLNRKE